MEKIAPEIQGRIFAANALVIQVVSTVAAFMAGFLVDHVFEPAMMPGGMLAPFLGFLFGHKSGAGIALLYVCCSLGMVLIGVGGYLLPKLRNLESSVADYKPR